jgi:hypothetical protein
MTQMTQADIGPEIPKCSGLVCAIVGVAAQEGSAAPARFKARIVEPGYLVFETSQTEFASFVSESTAKWAKVNRAANIRAE